MPNSANVSGISAAMGMFRPNTLIGAKNALIQGKQPHSTPSGMPTTLANANPSTTRRKLASKFRVSALLNHKSCNCSRSNVSAGLGSDE